MTKTPGVSTLWLPLATPSIAWGAVLFAGVLYAFSMARGIGFYDSGELAVASVQLGLAHPPGQPIYTLLGFFMSHLPFVSPLVGLNLLSAVCGALTILPAMSMSEQMLPIEATESRPVAITLASSLAVLSQHAALWEQSTRIEVYALAVLLALWSLARLGYVLEEGSSAEGYLALGAVLGLCASVNPVIAVFAGLAGSPSVFRRAARRALPWSAVGWLSAGMLLGLVPYVYVPLIAERTDRLIWGAPTRGSALIDYLTVRDFRRNVGVSPGVWLGQFLSWLDFASDSGLLPLWIVGLAGHVITPPAALTRWCSAIVALLSVFYLSHQAVFRPELPDCVSYASLATWLCCAGCAALIATLWLRGSRFASTVLSLAVAAAALIAPPFAFTRTRRFGDPARSLATLLLDSLPKRTLLVVSSDHWVAPLWYLQEIERKRPDVVVIAGGLLSSSWYFDHLYRVHRELAPIALRGEGGAMGRLSRLLAAQPDRPIAFEDERHARALGFDTCLGAVFAHARTACSDWPGQRTRMSDRIAQLTRVSDAGEPTVTGVLAEVSLDRARMLAAHGFMADALRALFSGVDPLMAKLDTRLVERAETLPPSPLPIPHWRNVRALGDPAQNLFVAAEIASQVGDLQNAVVWLMLARELGLPEAGESLARLSQGVKIKP